MVTRVLSGGVHGVEGFLVDVEADISDGLPMFEVTGSIGSEVREARDRVRTALNNIGISMPVKRITVNLAPADRKKYGTLYDLPIAVSILRAMEEIDESEVENTFFAGELMLSGKICSVKGILPMVLCARKNNLKRCIIPKENEFEGSAVDGIDIIGVESLEEVILLLKRNTDIKPCTPRDFYRKNNSYDYDMSQINGQLLARRGMEIAAAGYHNILMVGPPGAGKTMMSKCMPSIMPPLTKRECIEVSALYSVGGMLDAREGMITKRPFIAPHHTATEIAMIGGGIRPRPGAVSYASRGILFLDEFPEFPRSTLEALRQPLEDKSVRITRNLDTIDFPADFMLVAAMNPCPCGAYPDISRCTCTKPVRIKYLNRLSKPLLDRIDICLEVQKVRTGELLTDGKSESSESIRERVINAHNIQKERFKNKSILFNSQMNNSDIERYCALGDKERQTMGTLIDRYALSARGYYRILKVARTISDLAGESLISETALYEAVRLKCSSDILKEV